MTIARITGGALLALVLLILGLLMAAWTPDRRVASLTNRWGKPPSQFMALDGMQIHFRDEGPRNDPTPIILLHGTASSLYSWDGWAEPLKARHRVIRFDRPGFALTGPNPSNDYSMRYYADFLAKLMDELQVKRAIITGNSSGGRMAWEFAAAYPDRTAGLILVAPAGYPRSTALPMGLRIAMAPWASPILAHILPRSQVTKGLQGSFGDPAKVTPEMVDRSYELTLREGNRTALGETLRQAQETDNSAKIATIKTPTLILWGTKDTVIPMMPDAERFHHDIADSRLVTFPGLGHMVQEEAPAASLAPIKQFLQSIDSGVVPKR